MSIKFVPRCVSPPGRHYLGYGDSEDYDTLYAQLDEIEKKTAGGKSGEGFFDKMKTSMSDLWASIAR